VIEGMVMACWREAAQVQREQASRRLAWYCQRRDARHAALNEQVCVCVCVCVQVCVCLCCAVLDEQVCAWCVCIFSCVSAVCACVSRHVFLFVRVCASACASYAHALANMSRCV